RHTRFSRDWSSDVCSSDLFFQRYPGLAVLNARFRNTGSQALEVDGWRVSAYELALAPGGFWSFSGASHTDRRDWVQPVSDAFERSEERRVGKGGRSGGARD